MSSLVDELECALKDGSADQRIKTLRRVNEKVTDALLARDDHDVICKLAANSGAEFSSDGFATLLRVSKDDESLAILTGIRPDFPSPRLHELIVSATETVRIRLIAAAPARVADELRHILKSIEEAATQEATRPRDFATAKRMTRLMMDNGELDETMLCQFAKKRLYEETVAALAALSSASIEIIRPLMQSARYDGLLVPCKVIGLQWPTVSAILNLAFGEQSITEAKREQARIDFSKLTQDTAQRLFRFWLVREKAALG